MYSEQGDTIRRTWETLESPLGTMGYELIEVEYGRENASWVLRLFIDKPGGVTLDDCQSASRAAGMLLDAADFIDGQYMLEMSSPGFDRPLRKPGDFERFAGERVRIVARTPVAGRRQFKGILRGVQDGLVSVDCGGVVCTIHLENIKKARLDR
ncbi:MAG TPA: ribosome maturation factor RimP [Candidatus Hydrogenedentes bacterium]|nr:ribosome maturation factor RimP [Candidatus Hydrogenedentota bacterium]HOV76031.1 ribosome maturation factor RimP [Candidatus Hydrogenedentota bacterium]HPC18239.1 ribosome maturation factor RimP [Candidatus Hydrogenedentota bacterium]HRT21893.1 ribosome maturation factor RimP [Candidatus Hydrogenedentota bacterium]HRT66635.1 ribosome maturation factor RimP [Candidatus Hydrogenedentota bacterium]